MNKYIITNKLNGNTVVVEGKNRKDALHIYVSELRENGDFTTTKAFLVKLYDENVVVENTVVVSNEVVENETVAVETTEVVEVTAEVKKNRRGRPLKNFDELSEQGKYLRMKKNGTFVDKRRKNFEDLTEQGKIARRKKEGTFVDRRFKNFDELSHSGKVARMKKDGTYVPKPVGRPRKTLVEAMAIDDVTIA